VLYVNQPQAHGAVFGKLIALEVREDANARSCRKFKARGPELALGEE
jgi:hypothetical protein